MATAPIPLPIAVERRLETPTRDHLLQRYAATERLSKIILLIEAVALVAALFWVLLGPGRAGPLPWLAAALGGFGVFRWLFHHAFLNKKRLADIRPDARFGLHTKESLLALVARVFERLQLPPDAAPVFMTRAKDINAHAVRCELLPGRHLFNGVYLNRAIIHLLDEAELESVVGHELGHVFPYAPLLSRCYLLHALCAAALAFAITATFPFIGVAVLAPLALLWVFDRIIAFPHLRLSRGVEFLCDDFGARAAGWLPAMSCEFKIAAEAEARQQILHHLLDVARQGQPIQLHELMAVYDEAVPFGRSDPAAVRTEIERLASARAGTAKQVSLGGFLQYLGERDDVAEQAEAVNEELNRLNLLAQLPLLPIAREPYLQGSAAWTPAAAERLIQAIERQSTALLFRHPEELSDQHATHPNVSRRLLFLWRNRASF